MMGNTNSANPATNQTNIYNFNNTNNNNNNNNNATNNNNKNKMKKKKTDADYDKKEPPKPKIPIDPLCKADTDPFIDDITVDDDDFMRNQYEIEYDDIAGFPSNSQYSVSSWTQSKDFICCQIYYNFNKKLNILNDNRKALLIITRAVVDKDDNSKRFIEINLIDLLIEFDNDKSVIFDPSDASKSYRFRDQYILPLIRSDHNKQHRLKTELHPLKPLLFVFTRNNIVQGQTIIEVYNLLTGTHYHDISNKYIEPNTILSFSSDYYLNNEPLETNNLIFVTKKLNNIEHDYIMLFHKPELEQNISSGSKLVIFDLTKNNMNSWKTNYVKNKNKYKNNNKNKYNNNNYNYNNYNYNYYNHGYNACHSINFNSSMLSILNVGHAYHHNLINVFNGNKTSKKILISFRIHHVKLIDKNPTPTNVLVTPPSNDVTNFSYESWSEIYYVKYDLLSKQFSDVTKNGFKSLPLAKTSDKESNCVESLQFSEDGKFFAIIKQREHNDEALFRIYRTGETNKNNFICQMTNIEINPWQIILRSHFSLEYGLFFTISHFNDDPEKAWIIIAGPNIHGDLQTYRQILREWLYDDAISIIISMIGLSHRYTLHLDIGYFAGEQMANYDYNKYLNTMVMGINDATYLLFQN